MALMHHRIKIGSIQFSGSEDTFRTKVQLDSNISRLRPYKGGIMWISEPFNLAGVQSALQQHYTEHNTTKRTDDLFAVKALYVHFPLDFILKACHLQNAEAQYQSMLCVLFGNEHI